MTKKNFPIQMKRPHWLVLICPNCKSDVDMYLRDIPRKRFAAMNTVEVKAENDLFEKIVTVDCPHCGFTFDPNTVVNHDGVPFAHVFDSVWKHEHGIVGY